jgi:hypothetical protein
LWNEGVSSSGKEDASGIVFIMLRSRVGVISVIVKSGEGVDSVMVPSGDCVVISSVLLSGADGGVGDGARDGPRDGTFSIIVSLGGVGVNGAGVRSSSIIWGLSVMGSGLSSDLFALGRSGSEIFSAGTRFTLMALFGNGRSGSDFLSGATMLLGLGVLFISVRFIAGWPGRERR